MEPKTNDSLTRAEHDSGKLTRLSIPMTGGRMVFIVGFEDSQALDPQIVGRKFASLGRGCQISIIDFMAGVFFGST
jgi:hypothetical protein